MVPIVSWDLSAIPVGYLCSCVYLEAAELDMPRIKEQARAITFMHILSMFNSVVLFCVWLFIITT